jgi:hypothetical protein
LKLWRPLAAAFYQLAKNGHVLLILWTILVGTLDQLRRNAVVGFSDCPVLEIVRKAGYLPIGTEIFRASMARSV